MLLDAQSYSAGEFGTRAAQCTKSGVLGVIEFARSTLMSFDILQDVSEPELWIYPPAGTVASMLARSLRHNFCMAAMGTGRLPLVVPLDTAMGNLWPDETSQWRLLALVFSII